MMTYRFRMIFLLMLGVLLSMSSGCGDGDRYTDDGKLIISYWEKWTGFEHEAMKAVVDDYNASQDKVHVEMLQVSQLNSKLLLATAGGNPPDVAGVWSYMINTYAEKGALTPLDKAMVQYGITEDKYIPAMIDLCRFRGFTWALPTTPATLGLHWNKKLFREAGLDPDMPPKSIEELDRMSDQLTIVELERDGKKVRVRYPDLTEEEKEALDFEIIQVGHLPQVPGWYNSMWVYWFGGDLLSDEYTVSAASKEGLEALRWYQGYTKKLGLKNMQKFAAGFGNFASPEDAFLAGKVAMVIQGVWMHNFIEKYNPGMEWAATAFPTTTPELTPFVTLVETDALVVPSGSKHPKEAFDFIAFVQKQENIERLCLGQMKFSPQREVSSDFVQKHPNPYIEVFIEGAWSSDAKTVPRTGIWNEYSSELSVAYEQVMSLRKTPEEAMEAVQERMQRKLDSKMRRWDKVKKQRLEQWTNNDTF